MFAVVLFAFAVLAAFVHLSVTKTWRLPKAALVFFMYLLFFNVGICSLISAYGQIFMGPEIAEQIGWPPNNPFEFEVGIANLSYGVLGIISCWLGGSFRVATVLGWSLFLLGAFIGHMVQYHTMGNTAPYNFGVFVWFNDLFIPILTLTLLVYTKAT